MHIKSLDSVSL